MKLLLIGLSIHTIKPKRWADDFERLDIPQEIKEKVLAKNAVRVLKM